MNNTGKHPIIVKNQQRKYSWGHGKAITNRMGQRTVEIQGAFFLTHLEPGMKVLDCGCGPGSITIGIAQAVSPGETVGIDVGESQIEAARSSATNQQINNVRFEIGSVYELPFANNYFDAVFCHGLLEHLCDPTKALKEMVRVLKPRGCIGCRETDKSGRLIWPQIAGIQKLWDLADRLVEHNGGDSGIGRRLRSLLCQIGLENVEASASYDCHGKPETIEFWMQFITNRLEIEGGGQVLELGWSTEAELDEILAAHKIWAKDPGAFLAHAWCEAIGWKEHRYDK